MKSKSNRINLINNLKTTKFNRIRNVGQYLRADIVAFGNFGASIDVDHSERHVMTQFRCFVHRRIDVFLVSAFLGIERSREHFDGVAFLVHVNAIHDEVILAIVDHIRRYVD